MEIACKGCGAPTDNLALFPGDICVECYAKTPEALAPMTADDLSRMWGWQG